MARYDPDTVARHFAIAKEQLEDTEEILKGKGWCQGTSARDTYGNPTDYLGDDATCFCLTGALNRANQTIPNRDPLSGMPNMMAHVAVRRAIDRMSIEKAERPSHSIVEWNDRDGRTKEEVEEAVARGIIVLEEYTTPETRDLFYTDAVMAKGV